jgi:hypothetical protein
LVIICLSGVQPAAADSGVTVTVNDGALTITGSPSRDDIQLNQISPGTFAVWVTPSSGVVEVHNVTGITGDVTITTGPGDDSIRIGNLGPTELPEALIVDQGPGYNSLYLTEARVADDLTVTGRTSVELTRSTVAGDLVANSGDHPIAVFLIGSTVDGLVNVNATGTGVAQVSLVRSEINRLRVKGNRGNDWIQILSSDLGFNPRFDLGAGNDGLRIAADSHWSGSLRLNAGNGTDTLDILDEVAIGVPIAANNMGRIVANLGNGDDFAHIHAPITTARSVVNGQGGFDHLQGAGYDHPSSAAAYRLFEDIETPPEDKLEIAAVAGDLHITVNDLIGSLWVDSSGDDYQVAYRDTDSFDEQQQLVTGITGDVTITVRSNLYSVNVGTRTPTTVSGALRLAATNGAGARFDVYNTDVGGDINVTADARYTSLHLFDSSAGGRLDARSTGPASLGLSVRRSALGRFRVNGAGQQDTVLTTDTHLGAAPLLTLRGGDDIVRFTDSTWTGRLQLNAGTGSDTVTSEGTEPIERLRMLLGAGDDQADIHGLVNDGLGSQLQGDAGTDQLTLRAPTDRATVRTFEAITYAL